MKKRTVLLIGLLLAAACIVTVIAAGRVCTVRIPVGETEGGSDDFTVEIEQSKEVVRLTDKRMEKGTLLLEFASVSQGRADFTVSRPDGRQTIDRLYVLPFGVITVGVFGGRSTGSWIIPAMTALYTALLFFNVALRYRRDMQISVYRYRNIRNLGWMIFLALMLLGQLPYLFSGNGLVETAERMLSSASMTSKIALPIAFILSILVAISNIRLMRREGRNWRNMLGVLLGLVLCVGTVFPFALSEYLQRSTIIDVHNQKGAAIYIEMALTNVILVAVSYLECILCGTIILAVKAAKMVPEFDREYILILGCRIRDDGGLTPLLKGRADRALEFAGMQREATGKELVFVPSGGKGSDEIISEGQAVRNYLLSMGVPEERVITEDRSVSTYENFKFSMELIRGHSAEPEPKIAFATTNYHVFRSGAVARSQGIDAEGIGSRTRSYFWINAFVREFIATVYNEWRRHLRVIAALSLLILAMVFIVGVSNFL